MFGRPVSRLSRHIPLAISFNSRTSINLGLFTPTRGPLGAGLLQVLRNYCDKHDGIDSNIQPSTIHTTIIDPQTIVALGALTVVRPEHSDNDYRPSTFKPRQNDIDSLFERHTASLLDGLATVCVHRPEDQVFALAMQLDHAHRRIRLTIAGNDNVNGKVVQNLEAVWKILQDISGRHVDRARVCGEILTKKQRKRKRSSGKKARAVDSALVRRLRHTIYQFTSKTLLSRLGSLEFRKFAIAFKKNPNPDPTGDHKTGDILIGVINVIENTLVPLLQGLKHGGDLRESGWETMNIMTDGVLHDCENILDHEGFCERCVTMARHVDKTSEYISMQQSCCIVALRFCECCV